MLESHSFPFGSPLGPFEPHPQGQALFEKKKKKHKRGPSPVTEAADACAGALPRASWVPPIGRCPFWGRGNGLWGRGQVPLSREGSRGPSRGCGSPGWRRVFPGVLESGGYAIVVTQRSAARPTCCGKSDVDSAPSSRTLKGPLPAGGGGPRRFRKCGFRLRFNPATTVAAAEAAWGT